MTYWFIGDEEHNDERFTTATLGLYVRAGSWCMAQCHYRPEAEIPAEWFVPRAQVRGWGALRLANDLADQGVWEQVAGGWRYVWIRHQNTADHVRADRKRERGKWARKQSRAAADSPGESGSTPQGSHGQLPGGR
jgi:hypothetical protein